MKSGSLYKIRQHNSKPVCWVASIRIQCLSASTVRTQERGQQDDLCPKACVTARVRHTRLRCSFACAERPLEVQSWADSPELLNVDLSHNNLSGSIPDVEMGKDLLIKQPRTHTFPAGRLCKILHACAQPCPHVMCCCVVKKEALCHG